MFFLRRRISSGLYKKRSKATLPVLQNRLKTLSTTTWQKVTTAITNVVSHAIIFTALADFFALK
jgi:hypothetical protein